jgi:four helix bundle protein
MSGGNYRNLIAWQRAMDVVVRTYEATEHFPECERFGLARQMCRAAVSAPSNIAEGRGRVTRRDFRHFLIQARGSLYELETQLEIACRLQFISVESASVLSDAIAGTPSERLDPKYFRLPARGCRKPRTRET